MKHSAAGAAGWLAAVLAVLLLVAPAAAGEEGAGESKLAPLVSLLGQVEEAGFQLDLLRGMHQALEGRRRVRMPEGWPAVAEKLAESPNAEVREKAQLLSLIFGDEEAVARLRKVATDPAQEAAARRQALSALVQSRLGEVAALLQELVADEELRGAALKGLAAFDHPETPGVILGAYGSLNEAQRRDAVSTLASRPGYALALLDAVEAGRVPRTDLPVFVVRQLLRFENERINERLEEVWGVIRETSEDKAARIGELKQALTAALEDADRAHGRRVFAKTCSSCHVLFDAGRRVGPDLTGSQRANLDYVLQNLVDPNALVGRDYQMTILQTTDGRVINGLVKQEDDNTLTVLTQNDTLILPKEDVEVRKRSDVSMMPEGMLEKLSPDEIRDLVSYLASPAQVPLEEE